MRPSPMKRLLRMKFKTYFLAGLLVVGPIGLTFALVQWIVNQLDRLLMTLIPATYHPDKLIGFHIPGLGLVCSALLILLVGMLAANYLGAKLVGYSEQMMYKIPLVKSIYTLFKQVADTTFGKERKGFRKVVLIEYPRRDIWAIGFVTGETGAEIQAQIKKPLINVFVPTTPNPTSGFYILVPQEDTITLAMSVEEAFKLVVSGGMVPPQGKRPPRHPASGKA